jgi:hypothetical protein
MPFSSCPKTISSTGRIVLYTEALEPYVTLEVLVYDIYMGIDSDIAFCIPDLLLSVQD